MGKLLIVSAIIGAAVCVYRRYVYRYVVGVGYAGTQSVFLFGENAKAARERDAKRDSYFREYLGYGFSPQESQFKADSRLQAEAKAADEVKP